jgi:prepilin-type N-terminal cleavage/methylation domain-containing protein
MLRQIVNAINVRDIFMKIIEKKKKGFSLIEALITVTILSVGITSISFVMAKNIKSTGDSRDQIVASELAQEGVELVRSFRDNNATFFTQMAAAGFDYPVDYKTPFGNFKNGNSANDGAKRLYINGSGFFEHTAGANTKTRYFRKVAVVISTDAATGKKIATVTAFVSWNNVGFPFAYMNAGNYASESLKCTVGNRCVSIVSTFPDLN